MKLEQVAQRIGAPGLSPSTIASDDELAREIQGKLMLAGVLDPPVDGAFGAISEWALSVFAKHVGQSANLGLTAELAAILVAVDTTTIPPIDTSGNGLADKVVRAMQRLGYHIARHPDCVNIAYLEGAGIDGKLNRDEANKFNDLRLVFSITTDHKPKLLGQWEATTEPGTFWTMNPMNPDGAARIAFDQYKSWGVGIHRAGTSSAHDSLVQTGDVTVWRDKNRDGMRPGDDRFTGKFGINQHWGFDNPVGDIGSASAGCLVGRTKAGHREFMKLVKKDPRFEAGRSYRFLTAVMPGHVLSAPATPAPPPPPVVAAIAGPSTLWVETALRITGHFEDSSNPMAAVTGDFDGMGISLGVLQWNIGSGSLQPLVRGLSRVQVAEAMPLFGSELWEACNSDIARGLAICRGWHSGSTLRRPVASELRAFTGGPAFVRQQVEAAQVVARQAYRAAESYAADDPVYDKVTKALFCWFFDVVTQNGGLKGLSHADVAAFIAAASVGSVDDFICAYLAGRGPAEAGFRDSRANADLWRNKVPDANLSLLVLSYLRSQKSRTEFRGDVLNRKGTIALGIGFVHREKHDLRALMAE